MLAGMWQLYFLVIRIRIGNIYYLVSLSLSSKVYEKRIVSSKTAIAVLFLTIYNWFFFFSKAFE